MSTVYDHPAAIRFFCTACISTLCARRSATFVRFCLLVCLGCSGLGGGAIPSAQAQGKEIYVSPQGRDANPGTQAQPFRSLGRAQAEVRKSNQSRDVTVFLRQGEYPLAETLLFSASDGGQAEHQVTYRAFAAEKPVLTGGLRISGWVPDQNGIFKAPVPGMNFRQLYVNNRRATRARQPDVGAYHRLSGWDQEGQRLLMPATYLSDWRHFERVEAVIQMYWAESYVHLASYEKSPGGDHAYVSVDSQQAAILFPRPYPQKQDSAAFHFENAYEFITQPGEWYLDTDAEVLYYRPQPDQDIRALEIIAPATETLLRVEGTAERPVRNLNFRGLTFSHSNWKVPSQRGYLNAQAGMYNLSADAENNQYVRRPAAAIALAHAQRVAFEENLVQHIGATAVDLVVGTNACRITGNVLWDISGGGVMVGAFTDTPDGEYHQVYRPQDERDVCTDDQVSNNYIVQTGRDYYGTCPVAAGYPAGLTIEHNLIREAPYSGVSVGYGWTAQPSPLRDNLIARNDIGSVMQLLCDGGAIYTLSLQPNTRIVGNYLHDLRRSPWAGPWPIGAIYLDEASGGTGAEPMVVEQNSLPIVDITVRPYNLHREGIVLFKHNDVHHIEVVIEEAGLQPSYRSLIKKMLPDHLLTSFQDE